MLEHYDGHMDLPEARENYEHPAPWTEVTAGHVESAVAEIEQNTTVDAPETRNAIPVVHSLSPSYTGAGISPAFAQNTSAYGGSTSESTGTNLTKIDTFIEITDKILKENITHDVRSKFTSLFNKPDISLSPTCSLITLNYEKSAKLGEERPLPVHPNEDNGVCWLEDIHEVNKCNERHVIILGAPGEGKTVAAMRYAQRVSLKQVRKLKDVKLVHYIDVSTFNCNETVLPFDLLFIEQIGSHVLDRDVLKSAQQWLRQSPHLTLIVLDGLDHIELERDEKFIRISTDQPAKPSVIIRNLLRGDIYRGMWIVSTSRSQWMWKLPSNELPVTAIKLCGFLTSDVEILLKSLVKSEKHELLRNVTSRFEFIKDLCKTPLFLLFFAKIITQTPTEQKQLSLSFIMLNILLHIRMSFPETAISSAVINITIELAMISVRSNSLTFSRAQVQHIPLITNREMENFLDIAPSREYYEKLHESYVFRNNRVRDMLAALCVILQSKNFKDIMNKILSASNLKYIPDLVYGVVMHEELVQIMGTFTNVSHVPFKQRRSDLIAILRKLDRTQPGLLSFRLHHQCQSSEIAEMSSTSSKIRLDHVQDPCHGHAILSVSEISPNIKAVIAKSLRTDVSGLKFRRGTAVLKVSVLEISGDILLSEFETLSLVLKKNSNIKAVHLLQYKWNYSIEESKLHIEHLKSNEFDQLSKLLHHASRTVHVLVKFCTITEESRHQSEALEELDNITHLCEMEVELLILRNRVTHAIGNIVDILRRNCSYLVRQISLANEFNMSSEATYSNCSDIMLHGELTLDDQFVAILARSKWTSIETNDFDMSIGESNGDSRRFLTAVRKRQVTEDSIQNLCEIVIKVGFSALKLGDETISVTYTPEGDVKIIDLSYRNPYSTHLRSERLCRFVVFCNTAVRSFCGMPFYPLVEDGTTTGISIEFLQGDQLSLLMIFLEVHPVPSVRVEDCVLSNYGKQLQKINLIRQKTSLKIGKLTLHGKLRRCVPDIYSAIKACDVTAGIVGVGKDIMTVRDKKEITLYVNNCHYVIDVINAVKTELETNTVLKIIKLISGKDDLQTLLDLAKSLQTKAIWLNIKEIEIHHKLSDCFETILRLTEVTHIERVWAIDTSFETSFFDNGKINKLKFSTIQLENLNDMTKRCSEDYNSMTVANCMIATRESSVIDKQLKELISCQHAEKNLQIETLTVKVNIGKVIHYLSEMVSEGKIKQVFCESEYSSTLTVDETSEGVDFLVPIIDADNLSELLVGLNDLLPRISIGTCCFGEKTTDSAIDTVASMKIPDCLKMKLHAEIVKFNAEKVLEGLEAVDTFCSKYWKAEIKTLRIIGDMENAVVSVVELMEKYNIYIATCDVKEVKVEKSNGKMQISLTRANLDDVHRLMSKTNLPKYLELDRLCLPLAADQDVEETIEGLRSCVEQQQVKIEKVFSTWTLAESSHLIEAAVQNLKPMAFETIEYNIVFSDITNEPTQLLVTEKKHCDAAAKAALTNFASRIQAKVIMSNREGYHYADTYTQYGDYRWVSFGHESSTDIYVNVTSENCATSHRRHSSDSSDEDKKEETTPKVPWY